MGSSVVQVYLVHNLRASFLQFYARMYIAIVSDVRYKLRGNFTIYIEFWASNKQGCSIPCGELHVYHC